MSILDKIFGKKKPISDEERLKAIDAEIKRAYSEPDMTTPTYVSFLVKRKLEIQNK